LNELFQKRKHDDGEESPTKQVRSKKKGGDEETNPKGLKRKKGNDLGDFPSKRKKVGNSENDAKSSKRKKGDDVGESPLKQKRVGNSENKAKSSKSKKGDDMGESPSKPTRVGNRLKDFPAGNASTKNGFPEESLQSSEVLLVGGFSSHCGKLLFIWNYFLHFIFFFQPKASPIPSDFPPWASWGSRDVFLPSNFHTAGSFNKIFSIAKKAFGDDSILQGGNIDAPLLLLGLIYREVSRAMEIEPGGDGSSPDHLINSPFGIQQMKKIEIFINSIPLAS